MSAAGEGVPARAAVIGGGAWGTALAGVLAAAGVAHVRVFARNPAIRAAIAEERANPALPGVRLPDAVRAVDALPEAAAAPLVVLAVPAQATRSVLSAIAAGPARPAGLVLTAKGIESGTGRLQTEIAAETLPAVPAAVLSGPSFAVDVARGLPTAVTLAAADIAVAERTAAAFATETFRPYAAADPVGVQTGGALKNVYAIAAGIVIGAGLGDSARAALLARSIAELTRLAVAVGGRAETVAGLSGLGDLVLTATSEKSRNFSFGLALGRGEHPPVWRGTGSEGEHPRLVEGAATAEAAVALAARYAVDVPIASAVADVLAGRTGIAEAGARLMRRPLRREAEGSARGPV